MLTIAKMGAHSVTYYQSTVDENRGPDSYYSEDGKQPASAWLRGEKVAEVSAFLGAENGAVVSGKTVEYWFNKAVAPSGVKLGKALGDKGVPGFDLTFCAPKSVSLLWGMGADSSVRSIVDEAHQAAVSQALDYLSEHAGYTRKQDPAASKKRLIIEKLVGISGVKYEHRTSRAGDPHVHSHVLLANKQLCQDGKARTLDGVSLYHEARAAGMVYQATVREILSRKLGVEFGDVVNGCAEIVGLDDPELLASYSTRAREIDQWQADNGLETRAAYERIAQKITRRTKDTDTPLEELETEWAHAEYGAQVREFVAGLESRSSVTVSGVEENSLPLPSQVLAEVIAERSTFTRADVAEKAAELIRPGVVSPEDMAVTVERLVEAALGENGTWSVTPEKSRQLDNTQREGSQKYTTVAVVDEVERAVDRATARVERGVNAESIQPVEGKLSPAQADAMRAVVSSAYLASVVVAPAGAGKTSSLKAAHKAWNLAGKNVVGLAPTGKAADVMVGENVADEAMTISRAYVGTDELTPEQTVAKLGWGQDTVLVVDEAGMVSNPDMNRVLETASAAGSRVVFVGDPEQYSAVKARSGLLVTLSHELPDAVKLTEVFRQRDSGEREASKWLRGGEESDVSRAAEWYMRHERLHAGSVTAMMDDALAGWREDTAAGKQSLLVAATRDQVTALNAAAQKIRAERGEINAENRLCLSDGLEAGVGDVVLTRRNDSKLITSSGDMVRNGQRWVVDSIGYDGSITARRCDDTSATVTLNSDYLEKHAQLGYAATGHSSQGATVDVSRVVAGVGNLDKASVYVPMTRGREGNFLYIAETQPGDTETGHGQIRQVSRRESSEYARDLLVSAGVRAQGDRTPQALFGQAKQDWELAKLVNHPTHIDTDSPFAGTEMGAYMQAFAAKREARFVDFHARAQVDSTDEVAQSELASPCEQQEQDFGDALEHFDTEIDRVSAQLETLRGEYDQANQAVEQLGKQCEQQEQVVRESAEEKNARGFFGRLRHGKEDQAILDEAIRLRDKVAQHYDQAVDYRDSFTTPIRQLETELDALSAQRRDMQGLKKSMDFLDSLGMSATADDEMVSRIHQQAAADYDYENDQDNWLDNTPSNDGPEL
ncbi:MobF family relaxase (plasmid) [Corynebacterium rhinophilum]|uniref:MobF family relaxase n=1 Tax=Corynebacterium rhinophilum TaxID=3050197 RepID=UPI00397BB744